MNQMTQRCLFALFLASSLLCGCAKGPSAALPPPAEPEKPTIITLKPKVDQLLGSGDTVMIRRSIADVFSLIDLLLAAGEQDEAMRYMSDALKADAWALNYQMRYAEVLGQRGETEPARQKAKLVLEHAEQDELVERAQRILGREPLPPIPAIQILQDDTTQLVLVPVGAVDRCVLYDLQERLGKALSIPVLLQDARVSVPLFKRDPVKKHLAEVRTNLLEGMKQDIRLTSFLKQKGLTDGTLQQDEAVVAACRHLSINSGGTNALAQFDAGMRRLAQAPKQWDIADLLNNLSAAVRPFRKGRVYFMGVANLDAFMAQSNFIFGSGEIGGHHAMITYRRFTAQFNEENPDRKRLVERTLKQALSSFGFMLGIERCSTPTCARAYPHNLAEHDAKTAELCPACADGMAKALGVALRKPEQDQPGVGR